jgi:hypothetical protein
MPRRLVAAACLLTLLVPGCRRLAEHPLVVEAAEEVRQNARVAAVLGDPVSCSRTVTGVANETDGIATLRFDASGPEGTGVVLVEGKKTRDQWGVTMLELRPAGGERIDLSGDLIDRTGTDTPKFDPASTPAATPRAPPPPSDIEIALPPGPPGG